MMCSMGTKYHQNFKMKHIMGVDKAIVAAIAAIISAFVTGIFNWYKSAKKINSTGQNKYYQSLDKRIQHLETEYDQLKQKVNLWTGRYWALYNWLTVFCMTHGMDKMPPEFHKMDLEEIDDEFKEDKEYEDAKNSK